MSDTLADVAVPCALDVAEAREYDELVVEEFFDCETDPGASDIELAEVCFVLCVVWHLFRALFFRKMRRKVLHRMLKKMRMVKMNQGMMRRPMMNHLMQVCLHCP
jgi:hypothetical protein